MWSFFKDRSSILQGYEISETNYEKVDLGIWKLFKGKKKNGDLVSFFVLDIKNSPKHHTELAKTSLRNLRTLKHPNILNFIDSQETESVIHMITEYVIPLYDYLHIEHENIKQDQKEKIISWGIHQIFKGIHFLHSQAASVHLNFSINSVFVNCAGEWKIGGLEYLGKPSDINQIPSYSVYIPPELKHNTKQKIIPTTECDIWQLGCFIWEVFNEHLQNTSQLISPGKVPKSLIHMFNQMVKLKPEERPNALSMINEAFQPKGYFDNEFIKMLLFLEQIQLKDSQEVNRFLNSFSKKLNNLPFDLCHYKILPLLLNAVEYGNAGSSVLTPLLQIGKNLPEAECQKVILPIVLKFFESPDRTTRMRLLQQLGMFIPYLKSNVINGKIFPQIAQGFLDGNDLIREETVKAVLLLAPKLNYNNLNVELLKHFARLQSRDEHGGIRTNTTVCLGKIACYLHASIRQKVLIPAFVRALKDPFPPARIAGMLALLATQNYYTLEETALRVLPVLACLTIDPDKTVREQVFRTIKNFIDKLENVSENPSLKEEMEKDVHVTGDVLLNVSEWTSWALNSLGATFYKGMQTSKNLQNQETTLINKDIEMSSKLCNNFNNKNERKDSTSVRTDKDISMDKLAETNLIDWEEEEWDSIEIMKTNSLKTSLTESKSRIHNNTMSDGWEEWPDEVDYMNQKVKKTET